MVKNNIPKFEQFKANIRRPGMTPHTSAVKRHYQVHLVKFEDENDNKEQIDYIETYFKHIKVMFNKIIIHIGENKMIYAKQKSIALNLNEINIEVQKGDPILDNNLIFLFKISEIICGGSNTINLFDFLNKKTNLKFTTTIFNLFDINYKKDLNVIIQKKS